MTKKLRLSHKLVLALRQLTLADGNLTCVYCGENMVMGESGLNANIATIDHIVAQNLGGKHSDDNLVVVCMACNSSKKDRPLNDWLRHNKYGHLPNDTVDQIVQIVNNNISAITSKPTNNDLRLSLQRTVRKQGKLAARSKFADHLQMILGERIAI